MQEKYEEYRKKYSEFYYHNYEIEETSDKIIVKYNFEIKGLTTFEPTWTIEKKDFLFDKDDSIINNILFFFNLNNK